MAKKKRKIKVNLRQSSQYYDYNLLVSVILLTCFGLIMLYSSSAYSAQIKFGSDMYYFKKQAAISAGCLIIAIVATRVDYHVYAMFSGWIYLIANVLLFLTKFLGTELNGAKRWIYLGPLSFQPAEMAKVAVILFLPTLIVKMGKNMKSWPAFWVVLLSGGLTSFLTFAFTENLSTAIIIAGITVGLLFIVFPDSRPFAIGVILIALLAAGVVWYVKGNLTSGSSFRLKRILVWLNPEANSSLGGYQVMQGLYAIGSGGFFGKGLGNSLQKLDYVPEAQNDMIFTIICEELGLFGAIMLTILFAFMLYRLFFVAQNAPDLLGSLIASGIFIHIALQVVLNIAVVTNAIPTTGITLPFISYGGTSIMFLMAEMALALSVSRQIRFKDQEA